MSVTPALRNDGEPLSTSPDGIELSIIMPCLNEAETLEVCIKKAQGFLQRTGIRGEIVIGDNGSTDGSQEIARRNGARVVDVKLRGYGAALYYASLGARGKYLIMGDSDDSYDFTALDQLVEKLREGYDLVMGNRFLGGIRPGAMPWKNRYIGNPILSSIGRLFFHCPARDFHCGLRGYSRDAFNRMDLRTTGMEFASEMVIKSTLLGLRIAEVPTTLDPDGRTRPPHLRPWRDGWRHLRFMFLYSPRWLFLIPGLMLMVLGIAAVIALYFGNVKVGRVGFGVHTMLYGAAAVVVGYQAITYSVFTKVFAVNEGLLPEDPRLNRLFKYVTLESGLLLGIGLLVVGIIGTVMAFTFWSKHSFGPLNAEAMLRLVIPSALGLMLGSQTILTSFFLSILGMHLRPVGQTMKYLDRVIQRWRIRQAAKYVRPGDRLLDIGTADAALFQMIPDLGESIGVDPDLDESTLPKFTRVRFFRGYFPAALPEPMTFDVITMLAVLEHVPLDQQAELANACANHLRVGGRLIITVPSPAVDYILAVLRTLRLIHGMSLEQHYGFEASQTPQIFNPHGLRTLAAKKFQLGLNNLFVFERAASEPQASSPTLVGQT